MPCSNTQTCGCTPVCSSLPYVDTGCLDSYNTDCVKYTGSAITCLNIATGDTLTDILGHLQSVVCALTPASFASYNYGCFSTQNIVNQKQFAEFVSSILCQVLGTQTNNNITSLSTLNTSITGLTTQVNSIINVGTLDCFELITGLPGPTANIATLIAAIQQVLCSHDNSILSLQSLGGVPLTVTDSSTIDFTASGTANHSLTGSVKISATANNAISAQGDGIYVQSVPITVVNTPTVALNSSGTIGHTLTATVKISTTAGNIVTAQADGLYVPAPSANETPITPVDSNSVHLDAVGTSGHTISAAVKIDPTPGNIITVNSNGLYANAGSISVGDNSITNAKFRDSVGYSVIGRSVGSVGDPADISAASDTVLRRSGTGDLLFGTLVTNNIGDRQITFPKVQAVSSGIILGRGTAGTGDIEQLILGSNLSITAGTLNTSGRTLIQVDFFTSAGAATWTKPTGCNAALVIALGSGGGGGYAAANTSESAAASGGGSGAFSAKYITASLGATEAVTVAAGGAGATGAGASGLSGGTTNFGGHIIVGGGVGGANMLSGTTTTIAAGAAGGTVATGGQITAKGNPGSAGIRFSGTAAISGRGGASHYGGSAKEGTTTTTPGAVGGAPGAGGSGGVAFNNTDAVGGNGADGIIIVYSYS